MNSNRTSSSPARSAATRSRRGWKILCLLWLSALTVWACSVPVFRYALERWPADSYRAVIFHRGPLPQETDALLRPFTMEGRGLDPSSAVNLEVLTADLQESSLDPALTRLWETVRPPEDSVPWMVLFYPPESGLAKPAWSGPFSSETFRQCLDSPLRQDIGRRLAAGASTVWVFLENTDSFANESSFELLQKRLAHLEQTLELEQVDQADIDQGLISVPQDQLQIKFPLLRLSRENPREQELIQMLLGIEPDLRSLPGPMAFPVFGRGRALYALVGPGINHETIDEAARFLIGPCSCQVKELNPGVDLLLNIAWDKLVVSSLHQDQELPPLSGFGGLSAPGSGSPKPSAPTASGASQPPPSQVSQPVPSATPLFQRILLLGSVLVLTVAGITGWIILKKG